MALPTDDKARKALPLLTFLTEYFPDAIIEMVKVSVQGNIQHNPELAPADIKWARGKSTDQLNTAFRHIWDHKTGTTVDSDGMYHLAKAAWRVLAQLQLTVEHDRAANDYVKGVPNGVMTATEAHIRGVIKEQEDNAPLPKWIYSSVAGDMYCTGCGTSASRNQHRPMCPHV